MQAAKLFSSAIIVFTGAAQVAAAGFVRSSKDAEVMLLSGCALTGIGMLVWLVHLRG